MTLRFFLSGRTFKGDSDDQADPSRVGDGADRVTGLTDFSTLIDGGNSNNELTGALLRTAYLVNKTDAREQAGFEGIDDTCAAGHLSDTVRDSANRWYVKVQKSKLLLPYLSLHCASSLFPRD